MNPQNLEWEIETSPRPPPRGRSRSVNPQNLEWEIETVVVALPAQAVVIGVNPQNLEWEIETCDYNRWQAYQVLREPSESRMGD